MREMITRNVNKTSRFTGGKHFLIYVMVAGPDYGIGIVGKCLGPTTSKDLRIKMDAKYLEYTLVDQSVMFYAL